jgi:DNA-binding XRE family transcriptional regulator
MTTESPITRKQLCSALHVSEKTLVRHERDWGLNLCICAAVLKPKLYWLDKVNAQLLRRKVIREPLAPG